ncbi:MAG: GNAT family N-acetyltransferase [Desulfarculaceae bacterium]|jgi:putative acetyltransferase
MAESKGGAGVHIRPARPDDAEGICRAHHGAVEALAGGHYQEEVLQAWAGNVTVEAINNGLKQAEIIFLVAESLGEIAGFGVLGGGYIRAVYVHPAHQRKGIGSLILGQLEAQARALGTIALRLDASLNAEPFYRSHGYRVLKKAVFKLNQDTGMDSLVMEKRLGGDGC